MTTLCIGNMIFFSPRRHLISAHRQYGSGFSQLSNFSWGKTYFRHVLVLNQVSPTPPPPKLDFGSALFLSLLSGQIELNPGPPMSGSLKLSSIFPCGNCENPVTWEQRGICCDSCNMWFHKDFVDIRSFTSIIHN